MKTDYPMPKETGFRPKTGGSAEGRSDGSTIESGDPINHPKHYCLGQIEVITFIEDKKLSYHLSSVIKYVCRAGHKGNKITDLKKAIWFLEREIHNCAKNSPL